MRRTIKFVKFQGCGNDFLIIDETRGRKTSKRQRSRLASMLTDRQFGVGADGLMFLEPAKGHDCAMRLFEPAGNEADMCGNGIRCIAAYMMGKLRKNAVNILTRDGSKRISMVEGQYQVEMGEIRTRRADLRSYVKGKGGMHDSMMSFEFHAAGKTYKGSIVNSGEPHIVVRTRYLDAIDMIAIGESVNSSKKRFPKGVNVNFAQVIGPHSIRIRTYERGVFDETLACGTGATACAAVALMLGWVSHGEVKVMTRGGPIGVHMDRDHRALMTGPAERVYSGEVQVDL